MPLFEDTASDLRDFMFLHQGNVAIDITTTAKVSYEARYLEHYRNIADTEQGLRIASFRKAYAEITCPELGSVLDFGCGFCPIARIDTQLWEKRVKHIPSIIWQGTDVNDDVALLPHMTCDKYSSMFGDECMNGNFIPIHLVNWQRYDVICMFDVLEHFSNYRELLGSIRVGTSLVITVPTLQKTRFNSFNKLQSWKHYKPGEHYIYATQKGWIALLGSCGFVCLDVNKTEVLLGRTDIMTFTFKKTQG